MADLKTDVAKIVPILLDATVRRSFDEPTPGTTRLAQTIMTPLIKASTEQYDLDKLSTVLKVAAGGPATTNLKMRALNDKSKDETNHPVFSSFERVASTSELLLGYYSNKTNEILFDTLNLEDDGKMGDTLAFITGSYYRLKERSSGIPQEPDALLDTMHKAYNASAVEILNQKAIPLFGVKRGIADDIGSATNYIGGLDNQSLVASQISGWMFTRPTSTEAQKLFRVVKEFHSQNISESVKKVFTPKGQKESNDIRILDNIALQILKARASVWEINDPSEELKRWKIEEGASPVEAALGSRKAVFDVLGMSEQSVKDTNLSELSQKAVDGFYDNASKAGSISKAIESAKSILQRLLIIDPENEDGKNNESELNENIEDLEDHIERLKEQIQLECKLTPVESKISCKRTTTVPPVSFLGSIIGCKFSPKNPHVISNPKHPKVLTEAFSDKTVAHFNSILQQPSVEKREKVPPLNQWLL